MRESYDFSKSLKTLMPSTLKNKSPFGLMKKPFHILNQCLSKKVFLIKA
ncbi:MAG: hypothetical protein R8K50_00960 [Mariprofundus sp.]